MKTPAGTFAFALILTAAVAADAAPLRTGVDGTFAPHAMPTLSGCVESFNIDLADEIGRRATRGIVIESTHFSGLLPGLQAGPYHLIPAPPTVTTSRAKNLLLTAGYLNTHSQPAVPNTTPDSTDLADWKAHIITLNRG